MIRILLIRHGSTDLMSSMLCGRMPKVSLNAEGRAAAESLAQALRSRHKLNAVISSPLERAVQTATPIAEAQQQSVTIDPAFNELDFGNWTGKLFTDLRDSEQWRIYNGNRATSGAPAGESLVQVQERAWTALAKLADRHDDGTMAVVSHGDVIRSLLLLFLGSSLDHVLRFEISPASVSEVTLNSGYPVVHYINRTYD